MDTSLSLLLFIVQAMAGMKLSKQVAGMRERANLCGVSEQPTTLTFFFTLK